MRYIFIYGIKSQYEASRQVNTRSIYLKIPLSNPIFNEEMKNAAISALEHEWYVLGESVHKFEEEFAKYCEAKYAVSVSSGTNALQLALISTGIKPGQEVITSPASFIASANAAIHANAVPKFADIDLTTYTIDPDLIKKSINHDTKCLMPVHIYGRPADIDPIEEMAKEKGLFVVADAAQAHGARYNGRRVGSIEDLCCFSFYSSKCMTVCGDGGMVVTNNEEKANLISKLRDCGRKSKYEHDVIGYTSRLNNVNAAIGRVQLRHLDHWNSLRVKIAEKYNKLLKGVGDIIIPPANDSKYESSYYLYVIRTSKRDDLKRWLEDHGIQCGVHYPIPIHLQPIYKKMYGYKQGEFANSEALSKTALSIPMSPELTDEEVGFICETISKFFKQRGDKNLT